MPRFSTTDETTVPVVGNYFQFSGANITNLGSTEYTLVGLTVDESGSVSSFKDLLNEAVKNAVESCRKSPRADNLLLRVTKFGDSVTEFHGFKEFKSVNVADYDDLTNPGGMTALFDAGVDGVDAIAVQAKQLSDADFTANAIFICITDGANNSSSYTASKLRRVADDAIQSESLESIRLILVGVNPNKSTELTSYLEKFRVDAGFDQYVEIEDATPSAFAKLEEFISKSISTQSQSLGSGSGSVAVTF